MHSIRSLDTLNRAEVRELAHAAAERHDQHANPFEPGTPNHRHWEHDYQEHALQLCEA